MLSALIGRRVASASCNMIAVGFRYKLHTHQHRRCVLHTQHRRVLAGFHYVHDTYQKRRKIITLCQCNYVLCVVQYNKDLPSPLQICKHACLPRFCGAAGDANMEPSPVSDTSRINPLPINKVN